MPEGIYITRTEWKELMKKIDYLESYVKNFMRERNKSKWMNEEEAMAEIGCKISKLNKMRYSGDIDWRYAGKGRLVMILRKSVEEYNMKNSTLISQDL